MNYLVLAKDFFLTEEREVLCKEFNKEKPPKRWKISNVTRDKVDSIIKLINTALMLNPELHWTFLLYAFLTQVSLLSSLKVIRHQIYP
jgi:hypothetical protein